MVRHPAPLSAQIDAASNARHFVSFVVAYASIAWLLRFVLNHGIVIFVGHRIALAGIVTALLLTGSIGAT